MAQWVRQSELARVTGLSSSAVHYAMRGALVEAVSKEGGRIDLDHPLVRRYLQKHRALKALSAPDPFMEARMLATISHSPAVGTVDASGSGPDLDSGASTNSPTDPTERNTRNALADMQALGEGRLPQDIEDLGAMTMREVAERFGTLPGLRDVVKSLKDFATMQVAEGTAAKKRGELVDRRIIGSVFLPFLEMATKRLVQEAPQALTAQIVARVLAGGDDLATDVESLIVRENSSILTECKSSMIRALEEIGG